MIFGTGFAPFRGGLLNYADSESVTQVHDTLEQLSQSYGDRFKPSEMLQKVSQSNKGFYEYF